MFGDIEIQTLIKSQSIIVMPSIEEVLCCFPVSVFPVCGTINRFSRQIVLSHCRRSGIHDTEEVLLATTYIIRYLVASGLAEINRSTCLQPRCDLI